VLLLDGSSREQFKSLSGQEWALHRSYQSLDRFDRLHHVLAVLQVVCNVFGVQGHADVLAWGHLQCQQYFYCII
jgi:hypothetical protein